MTLRTGPAIVGPVSSLARGLPWLGVVAALAALAFAVVWLAWVSDDAYITLRTVENLLAGHGPVWNVGERVQTYTHPAWFGLLAAARWLTGEHFHTTLALSWACDAVTLALLLRLARTPAAMLAVLFLLLGSRAFVDFATSGLETPLVLLLLVALVRVDAGTPPGGRRLFAVAAVLGLCGLTRLDLLLLGGPLVLVHMSRHRPLTQAVQLALAFLPLALFSAWAMAYYGSPLPITAYAKAIAPGVPATELLAQGVRYLQRALTDDPGTLVVIAAGLGVGFAHSALRARALAFGALLALGYVLRVGGDFMAGRFLLSAFAVAIALVARSLANARPAVAYACAGFAAGLVFMPGLPAWLRARAVDTTPVAAVDGIQDERRFYSAKFGLFGPQREIPQAGRFTTALRRQGRQRPIVLGIGMAGGLPYVAGELFHFVDPWLCDPLLMRLPVADPRDWRIGHFTRAIPDGYPEAIAFGGDGIAHPALARYYATLRPVLRAPWDARERVEALVALLSGEAEPWRRNFVEHGYRQPDRRDVVLDELRVARPQGTFWFDDRGIRCVGRGGLRLHSPRDLRAASLHLWVSPLAVYRLRFRLGSREVGSAECIALLDPGLPPAGDDGDVLGYLQKLLGLQRFPVTLPANLPAFDSVWVDAQCEPWTIPALGVFELTEANR